MIYVGIDVAKDKHDCFISNSHGEVLFNAFSIPNNREGFNALYQKIGRLLTRCDEGQLKVILATTEALLS